MPANCAPPRKGEAIAFGYSALVLAGAKAGLLPRWEEGAASLRPQVRRPAPEGRLPRTQRRIGELKQSESATRRFRLRASPRGLTFAPMELVPDLPMGTVPSWVSRRDKSRDDGIGRHEFRSCYDLLFLDGPPLQSKQPAPPRWMS
jgi:hypothetical protein